MDIIKEQNLLTINSNSSFYLAKPSAFASNNLYYMLSIGHFFANKDYIKRRHALEYNSFLLMYIIKGSMKIVTGGNNYVAKNGSIVLIDCYKSHSYQSLSQLEFVYVHFDGNNSKNLATTIISNSGTVFENQQFKINTQLLDNIINQFNNNESVKETYISTFLHTMLCDFLEGQTDNYSSKYSYYIQQALQYVDNNYQNSISVNDIATILSISPQHLTRLFKIELQTTPYNFIIEKRLAFSKSLLLQTTYTLEQISQLVGFNSCYNYMNTFKKTYNQTPTVYRKLNRK